MGSDSKVCSRGLDHLSARTHPLTSRRNLRIAIMNRQDADWLGFIAQRCRDALDDTLFRDTYVSGDEEEASSGAERRRVVVLGSGWGANAVLSQLKNAKDVDVTVISPRNYFLFTPMLAGAALGTLEPRSIIEPIRAANPKATYFEAEATSIDASAKTVTCENVVCQGVNCEIREFDVPYDQLVVAVGASTNTFGVKGVKENCLFMKQLSDAIRFREQLGYAFERASLPGLSDEERTRLLTFVVIGAGPTGVELCGELRDFVAQDVSTERSRRGHSPPPFCAPPTPRPPWVAPSPRGYSLAHHTSLRRLCIFCTRHIDTFVASRPAPMPPPREVDVVTGHLPLFVKEVEHPFVTPPTNPPSDRPVFAGP